MPLECHPPIRQVESGHHDQAVPLPIRLCLQRIRRRQMLSGPGFLRTIERVLGRVLKGPVVLALLVELPARVWAVPRNLFDAERRPSWGGVNLNVQRFTGMRDVSRCRRGRPAAHASPAATAILGGRRQYSRVTKILVWTPATRVGVSPTGVPCVATGASASRRSPMLAVSSKCGWSHSIEPYGITAVNAPLAGRVILHRNGERVRVGIARRWILVDEYTRAKRG